MYIEIKERRDKTSISYDLILKKIFRILSITKGSVTYPVKGIRKTRKKKVLCAMLVIVA
jgi:t-SNARE complex subunit (syntaxin)